MFSQDLPPGLQEAGGSGLAPYPTWKPVWDMWDFSSIGDIFSSSGSSGDGFAFFFTLLTVFQLILGLASLFFMLVIIYVVIQRNRVLALDNALYESNKKEESNDNETDDTKSKQPRFDKVVLHLESDTPSEWRVAIIEADNILYEILKRAGYDGETLGEMLTVATKANFRTLESAWEAHKVRNKIAHEGDLDLTKREAKRVIGLYESVFREFEYL